MIDLDAEIEVSVVLAKSLVLKAVKIDEDGNHTAVLLQIVTLVFDIRCPKIVVFFLICYLVDNIFKDKYLWILYYKFRQLC